MKLDSNPWPKNTSMTSLKEVRPTLTPVEKFHHTGWDKMNDKNSGSKPGRFNFSQHFFEDISPFCGAIDTPVLDFWWCGQPCSCLAEAYMLHVP